MKVSYTVVCAVDPKHKFPVVYEIEPDTEFETSEYTEICPFCGLPVTVTVEGRIEKETVFRLH